MILRTANVKISHMSLWMILRVGVRTVIGSLEIVRQADPDTDQTAPDAVSQYEVLVDGRKRGVVEHRYRDGPWALLRTALDQVVAGDGSITESARPGTPAVG
jgi:hypothetical protein